MPHSGSHTAFWKHSFFTEIWKDVQKCWTLVLFFKWQVGKEKNVLQAFLHFLPFCHNFLTPGLATYAMGPHGIGGDFGGLGGLALTGLKHNPSHWEWSSFSALALLSLRKERRKERSPAARDMLHPQGDRCPSPSCLFVPGVRLSLLSPFFPYLDIHRLYKVYCFFKLKNNVGSFLTDSKGMPSPSRSFSSFADRKVNTEFST